jgi:hypothetical protein
MKARKAALAIPGKDRKELEKISQSRTAPANRIQRAKILLLYEMGEKITKPSRLSCNR